MLGPGDDAAVVSAPDGRVAVSTDVLIEGRHFRRHWSSGYDVGRKAAAQNLADVAAMGAVPTAIVVGLGIPADLPIPWLDALTDGFRDECALVGASVAGGDITRCDLVVIGVTVLGDLQGRAPVERSGARPGHVIAVAGTLGRSAAGLALLDSGRVHLSPDRDPYEEAPGSPPPAASGEDRRSPESSASGEARGSLPPSAYGEAPGSSLPSAPREGRGDPARPAPGDDQAPTAFSGSGESHAPPSPGAGGTTSGRAASPSASGAYEDFSDGPRPSGSEGLDALLREAVGAHLRPRPPYGCGPEAARLGASAMIDVSDGLLQDLGHVAKAAGVRIDLDPEALVVPDAVAAAAKEVGADPLDWILTGGEDHALAAAFPPEVALPASWRVVGKVSEGDGVHVRGRAPGPGGWDHFR
ncbi:AIR synthase related protein [Nonomuraea sp. NPDC048826]|uniref:AIR synthase related protein n=1 Tax=Nonomuraea sp. NPDC048826 TaxID=3364347 RepID=UPI00371D7704